MKILSIISLFVLVATGTFLIAQVPSMPPRYTPEQQEELIRRALEKAYNDMAATNPAATRTNLDWSTTNRTRRTPATNATIALPPASTNTTPTQITANPFNPENPFDPASTTNTPATPTTTVAGQLSPATTPPSTIPPVPRTSPPATADGAAADGAGAGQPALSTDPATPAITTLSGLEGPDAEPDDQMIAPGVIKFQDADLLQVLDVYQDLTGRTILRPASLPAAKISIRTQTALTRKEAIQALDSILSLNGITMVPQGTKFIKALPEASAGTAGGEFIELEGTNLPNSGTYVTRVVKLNNASPTEVQTALTPFSKLPNSIIALDDSGILVLRDYSENVKRMLELLEQIDVVAESEFKDVVIPIRYALAGDIAQVLSSLTEGGSGSVTTVGSSSSVGSSGLTTPGGGGGASNFRSGSASQFGNRGGYGGGGNFGGGGYGGGGYGGNRAFSNDIVPVDSPFTFSPFAAATPATGNSFQDRLRNIVSRASSEEIVILGATKIIADERTNSLLIFATERDIKTIEGIIEKLDVVLAQVLIEAMILEVSLSDRTDVGISYVQRPLQRGRFTGAGAVLNGTSIADPSSLNTPTIAADAVDGSDALPGGFSYLGRFGNDFDFALRASATDGRINVLSRPQIQTSHAVPCRIFIGETRPYITGTYSGFGSANQSQISQLRIGIDLNVLPLINQDGLVVMDIEQRIDSVGENVRIDDNDVPTTVERSASAKVSVHDGETIFLGGFISNSRNRNKSGVPYLKDIPILGNLFRSSSEDNARRELIVLIRPTVLPTPQEAAQVAMERKNALPGIVKAEEELRAVEERQLKKQASEALRREGFANPNL